MNTPHRPRKRYGQNFLKDSSVVQHIISAIVPAKSDHFVEIGPGLGVLTEALLPHVKYLDAVEIDRDLVQKLKVSTLPLGNFAIHSADALSFNFCELQKGGDKLRVVGNLPYNISTPLLFHLLEQLSCIVDMHFMLQKEVVDRMAAKPATKDYGKLSVMVQLHCQVEKLFDVGPEAFTPAPKVNSAVVRLVPYTNCPVQIKSFKNFEIIVSAAFAQRRKTLHNNMKELIQDEQMYALGIDPSRRGETLSLEDFARISNLLPTPN